MKKTNKIISTIIVALGLSLTLASAGESKDKESVATPYPFKTCLVSGEALEENPTTWNYQGKEIKTCCKDCKKDFIADPEAYLPELDKAYIAAYPLKHCLVSKEPLGSMGDAYVLHHNGEVVLFCCKGCVKKFKKDSANYLSALHEAKANATAKNEAPAKPKHEAHHGHQH